MWNQTKEFPHGDTELGCMLLRETQIGCAMAPTQGSTPLCIQSMDKRKDYEPISAGLISCNIR